MSDTQEVFYRLVCSVVIPGHTHSFGCFRPVERGRLVDLGTIDYEAAARWTHAEMVRRGPTDLTWEAAYPEEQADHLFLALGAIGAALGDDKTVEEVRAAAFDLVDAAIGDVG